MERTPKIKYQLFLYNYYLQHIKHNLYNESYQAYQAELCFKEITQLTNEISDLEAIDKAEYKKYKKSRGNHSERLFFLAHIRQTVLSNLKETKLYYRKYIEGIQANETKLRYKNYDDYFEKHIRYYLFVQKIKAELTKRFDIRIENIYKSVYHPTAICRLLDETVDLDYLDVLDIYLHNQIQNTMYNIL